VKIELQKISAEGLSRRGEAAPDFIGLEEESVSFSHPVLYELELRRAGKLVVARGVLSTRVGLTCSRCLKKFDYEVQIPDFKTQVTVEDPAGLIDLTEAVREYIILALPYKPLCDGKCAGICPTCGKNLNEGPCDCPEIEKESSWDKLSEIFPEK